jgi:hypothetical protein
MRSTLAPLVLVTLLVTGCSLAGDITPPPALASEQALQPMIPAGPTGAAAGEASAETAIVPTTGPSPEVTPAAPRAVTLGTIGGTVVNGTAGGTVPAAIQVTLYGLDGDSASIVGTTVTQADATFSFDEVEPTSGRLYFVRAEYEGVEYESGSAQLPADPAAPIELPLTIYETTADRSTAEVTQLHLILLEPSEGTLRVSEVWVLSNSGDRAIVPSGAALLDIWLPQGAQLLDIQPSSPQDTFTETDQGLGYSTPLLPGDATARMAVTYDIPLSGHLTLTQTMDSRVESVVILTEQDGVTVRGPGIVEAGPLDLGTASLRQYVAGPLAATERLEVTVSASGRFPWDLVFGAAVLLASLLVVGVWWFRRPTRMGEREAVPSEPSTERDWPEEREALLCSIAALDDDFETGGLPEAEYRSRRDELKRRVLARMSGSHD